ncbi:MAG TPA: response regulator [Thermoanaerobaculia bacterium]|nr:response regulator [Thermoanaerobaculia bacterium]
MEAKREYVVLVVEDDPAIRRLVKMVLLRHAFRVDEAVDGLEAVLKLGLNEYDVIILDLMLPHLDGFTFLNTFAENQPEMLNKVIVTSAASPAVMRDRLSGKPFAVLPKPFDITALITNVKACLDAQSSS